MQKISSVQSLTDAAVQIAKSLLIEIPVGMLLLGAACLAGFFFVQNPSSAQSAAQEPNGSTDSKEPNAESQAAASTSAIKYIGNNYSRKFHRKSCRFALMMWQSRRHSFEHRHDATDIGYIPCRYCLPKEWTSVHATLLNSPLVKNETSTRVEQNLGELPAAKESNRMSSALVTPVKTDLKMKLRKQQPNPIKRRDLESTTSAKPATKTNSTSKPPTASSKPATLTNSRSKPSTVASKPAILTNSRSKPSTVSSKPATLTNTRAKPSIASGKPRAGG